jgi:membrane-associated protease RseP (regulator of RpoE activity)
MFVVSSVGNNIMQTFITIVILLVMLGILISAHEAGHLVMAKAFNVYCLEYSIGFGPKLFSKKRKGGETAFSLRALPLGGYVSMYGEGVELPDGVSVPPERSLNGVAAWKRAFILSAGIIVNLFLSLLFVVIYTTCIPDYNNTTLVYSGLDENGVVLADTSAHGEIAYSLWVKGTIGDYTVKQGDEQIYCPAYFMPSSPTVYFVVDPQAQITRNGVSTSYVACYSMSVENAAERDFYNSIVFFPQRESYYPTNLRTRMGLTAFPDLSQGTITLANQDVVTLNLTTIGVEKANDANRPLREQFAARQSHTVTMSATSTNDVVSFPSNALTFFSQQYYLSFPAAMTRAAANYANFFTSLGAGLKSLFSFDFSNLSSVVGMGGLLSQESTQIGWGRTFFLYGGFLSLNLAIFNLLPFPGLDGWQLLVTIVESGFKKKISDKVKNTISTVGLGLLLVFSVAIIIKDIVAQVVK